MAKKLKKIKFSQKIISEEELAKRKIEFSKEYPNIVDRLKEMREKMLWAKYFIDSILTQINEKGLLTDKQVTAVTSMYIDSCAWTERKSKGTTIS